MAFALYNGYHLIEPIDELSVNGVTITYEGIPTIGFGKIRVSPIIPVNSTVLFTILNDGNQTVVGTVVVDGKELMLIKDSGIIAKNVRVPYSSDEREYNFGN